MLYVSSLLFKNANANKRQKVSQNNTVSKSSCTHGSAFVAPPQWQPHRGSVPACSDDGVDQDGAQVGEEELVGHGVAGVQDDLRQEVEEENLRCQRERLLLVRAPDHSTQDEAKADEEGALGDHAGHMVVGLDDYEEEVALYFSVFNLDVFLHLLLIRNSCTAAMFCFVFWFFGVFFLPMINCSPLQRRREYD